MNRIIRFAALAAVAVSLQAGVVKLVTPPVVSKSVHAIVKPLKNPAKKLGHLTARVLW